MIKYIWQLPQNLLGLAVVKVTGAKARTANGIRYWYTNKPSFGVSLGNYIIIGRHFSTRDLYHEHGHQKQSLYLGPLYLLIIGLPSAIGNLLNRVLWFDYYKQPWEAWADKLGGVER